MMYRKEDAKRIPEEKYCTIYDMNVIGVRVRDVARIYKNPLSTLYSTIRL